MSEMDSQSLAARIDHAVLAPSATECDVLEAAAACVMHGVRGMCVTPRRAPAAAAALTGSSIHVVVVLGFPSSPSPREILEAEARLAVSRGATEVDLVLPWGSLLDGRWGTVRDELHAVVEAAEGRPVKAIVEASELPDGTIRRLVEEVLVPAHAAFLKTGTGVHGGALGAERIVRIKAMLPPFVRLKVSGGIRTREGAIEAIAAGADVLGMSKTFEILS